MQRCRLPLSNGRKAVLLAALRHRDALDITPPQPLRLEMLTDMIKTTNKLESVLQSTVTTSCISNVGNMQVYLQCCSEQCVGESVLQSTLLKVHLEVDASIHLAGSRCYRAHSCVANGAHDDLGMCY